MFTRVKGDVRTIPAAKSTPTRVQIEDALSVAPLSMMGEVVEEISKAREGLTRCLEIVSMITVCPDLPLATKHHVETSGKGNFKAADARPQRLVPTRDALGIRLDDEMEVIRLNREMDHAKVVPVVAAPLIAQHVRDEPMDALLPE
jgi:hypothetical protein